MKVLLIAVALLLIPAKALAHCPLCTAGAGVLAFGAVSLGVSNIIVGAFIGAFGIAMGLWLAGYLKKQIIPHQKQVLAIASFLLTVIPLHPILKQYGSIYIPWLGAYGTTILINLFILGAIMGAIIMFASPWVSRKLALARGGKMIPYQGMAITLLLLIVIPLLVDLFL